MQFESFADFIHMGGYGYYVWLAFGVSWALIIGLIVEAVTSPKRTLKQLAKKMQQQSRLAQYRSKNNES